MTVIKEFSDNVSAALAMKTDDEIRTVLNRAWPAGWTQEMIRQRCKLVRYHGDPAETLLIDGKPALEIHPPQFEQIPTDTGWTMRVTQQYRRLGMGKGDGQ